MSIIRDMQRDILFMVLIVLTVLMATGIVHDGAPLEVIIP